MNKITHNNKNKLRKIKMFSNKMFRQIRINQTFKRYVRWWNSVIKTNLNYLDNHLN